MSKRERQRARARRPSAPKTKRGRLPAVERQPIRGAQLSVAKWADALPSEFPEISDVKRRAYLAAYSVTGRFDHAAAAAGVTLRTGWNWRHEGDELFNKAVAMAQGLAADRLEAEIYRRGVEGFERPVYQQGRMVGTERVFSDVLLIFAAKGARPEKYRERYEHTGADGGPIQLQPVVAVLKDQLTLAELEQLKLLAAKAQKRDVK